MINGSFGENMQSFEMSDYLMARDVFISWQAKQSEELDSWLMRQRKEELHSLVRRVIRN